MELTNGKMKTQKIMINKFTKIISIALFLFASVPGHSRSGGNMKVDATVGTLVPVGGCDLSEDDGVFNVVSKQWKAGFTLKGDFDLREYSSIRFTISNKSKITALYLCCDLYDSRRTKEFNNRVNKAVAGVYEAVGDVPVESTMTVEFPLNPDMPHPEVNNAFRLMDGTPYSREIGVFSYDCDLSDVHSITIAGVNLLPGVEFVVSDIELVKGKRVLPAVMKKDSSEFFPFVDKYGQYKYKEWPGKIHSDKELQKMRSIEEKDLAANPGPQEWDQYGGWKNGPRFEATGQFYVKKIDGKWYNFSSSGAWTREEQVELSVLGKPSADKGMLVAKMVDAYYAVATYPSADLGLGGAATIDEFCSILYDEAVAENVRPELLFCQVMLETGWLRFGGSVTIDQFNFGGLGATGETGVKAASFESVQQGLRAQVQHLKAYSTEGITAADLAYDCVDPRFSLVRKGSAPYIQWLGIQENPNSAGWASSAGYGCNIVSMMQKKFGL